LTSPSQQRLDSFRQQSHIKAGSLIISVFGDAVVPRGGRIWLGSLIQLLEPLQVSERLIRTSVFRLAKEEWLQTEPHGRRSDYLLTRTGQRRFEEASRHIYAAQPLAWDRRWRLILVVGELAPKERERVRRALFWQGFGVLGADCFVHPNADLGGALDALIADGMSDLLGRLMPMLAAQAGFDLTATHEDMVKKAWNLAQLASAYEGFIDTYQPILEELRLDAQHAVDDQSAFLLRILLIHDYRRLLLRDPELPDVLLPPDWSGQKARLLCKELYRRLLAPSERHLEQHFQLADGTTPRALALLGERFQNDDPLADAAA
jgi:phenylacetic acid degradation operon negative regulatory protein